MSRVAPLLALALAACTARDVAVGVRGGDASADAPAADGASDGDPFDPRSACGSSILETDRVPGSVLFVFDRSSTMNDPPGTREEGPTKWALATSAIESVLASVSDELGAGLAFFPSPGSADECAVATEPQVPVAPLATSRSMISAALAGASPTGTYTPTVAATRSGWAHLDTLATPGPRGVVLVTDGVESCGDDFDALLAEAAAQRARDRSTFVVGLTAAHNSMSALAVEGGTRRTETCKRECTSRQCREGADCPGMASCFQPLAIEPGLCGCESTADCVEPQSCMVFPFFGSLCIGPTDCCHYNATEASFEADFAAALSEIARRFVDSCVFAVPKDDPASFDPRLVNVGVTFAGAGRTVVPRGDDPSVSSWAYTEATHDYLVIQGPICDRLRTEPATVEIVVGCPTILI